MPPDTTCGPVSSLDDFRQLCNSRFPPTLPVVELSAYPTAPLGAAPPVADITFCPRCATRLTERQHGGALRLACPACAFIHFDDPKVAVAVVTGRDGRVLLARRNHDPGMGLWTFPSGFVDRGEALEAAAQRETREEVGVEVSIDRLLAVRSGPGHPVILVAFAGSILRGEPSPGDEATDVGFFAPQHLPELAFPHDRDLIDAWLAGPGAPPAILTAAPPQFPAQ